VAARPFDWVSTGLVDLTENGYLVADGRHEQHVHLRIQHEAAILQHLRNLALGGRQRESTDLNGTDERVADGAVLRDASIETQIGALEDADSDDIARTQEIFLHCSGRLNGDYEGQ
jgi:hypothetical protein